MEVKPKPSVSRPNNKPYGNGGTDKHQSDISLDDYCLQKNVPTKEII
jgi:hypothetical protein